jgi:Cu/Ag efflux protein CusF
MTHKYLPGWLTLVATIFIAGHALALQTLPGEPDIDDRAEQAAAQEVSPFDEPLASGRVVAVDRGASTITLEYRPIPQRFLEGGTRIFRVENPDLLKGLGPGDKVRFEVERTGRRSYTVKHIENSN